MLEKLPFVGNPRASLAERFSRNFLEIRPRKYGEKCGKVEISEISRLSTSIVPRDCVQKTGENFSPENPCSKILCSQNLGPTISGTSTISTTSVFSVHKGVGDFENERWGQWRAEGGRRPRVISLICVPVRASAETLARGWNEDILCGFLDRRGLEKPAGVRLHRGTITEGLGCLMARWRPTIVTSQVVVRVGRGRRGGRESWQSERNWDGVDGGGKRRTGREQDERLGKQRWDDFTDLLVQQYI